MLRNQNSVVDTYTQLNENILNNNGLIFEVLSGKTIFI